MPSNGSPVRIFVINLDDDTERLVGTKSRLAALGLSFERFPAYQGANLPDWLKQQFFDEAGRPLSTLSPGEIGCYASHLAVARQILDEDIDDPVLVLEDDGEFSADLPDVLKRLQALPPDWQIVRMSSQLETAYMPVRRITSASTLVRYWYPPAGTTGYLINKAGAGRFLAAASQRKRPVDQDLRRFWETRLVTYGVVPRLIVWRDVPSTINKVSAGTARAKRLTFEPTPSEMQLILREGMRTFGLYTALRCIIANKIARKLRRRRSSEQAINRWLRVGRATW